MARQSLCFVQPYLVQVHEAVIPEPKANQVLVKTICSAISSGTEMLVYRGHWPENLPIDENITALTGKFQYPLEYGYACVGKITELGSKIDPEWLDKTVFSFSPHQSHFVAEPEQLIPIPSNISPEQAAFLPNMETAVSFIMDGKPLIGERVPVIGQGVVGLLTTSLLSLFPLGHLMVVDQLPSRLEKAIEMGANSTLNISGIHSAQEMASILPDQKRVDLCYEISGNPEALDIAINATDYSGRIIIGSWYGSKKAKIDLGSYFHRSRLTIRSSQVSRISPELNGLWSKSRRLSLAMDMLSRIRPDALVTHRFPITKASEAYSLIDKNPGSTIQVLLTY